MTDFVKLIYKKERFTYLWIIFLLLFLIMFTFIGLNKYERSNYYVGYIDNNNVSLLIDEQKITSLPEYVYFNNKKYDYEIQKISSDYILENNIRYRLVTLFSNFTTEDRVVDVKFIYGQTYLLNEVLKTIKGG